MGDFPKASDDPAWTEVERSFFAAAPPEEPQPLGEEPCFDDVPVPPPQRPRREIIAWLRPSVAGAWRRATVVLGAAGGLAERSWRRTARTCGAAVAALSSLRVDRHENPQRVPIPSRDVARRAELADSTRDRRRVVFALAGAVMAAGLTAGGIAFRNGAFTKGATAAREPSVRGPTVAEAAPAAISAAQLAPQPNVRSSAGVQAPRADVAKQRSHAHRRPVPASSPAHRPVVTAFVDRETYWAREAQSGPVRSTGPLFSR